MTIPKNAVTWFEIPVSDFQRAKAFYSKLFDFDMQENQMGDKLMGFFECDFMQGGIGGAIVKSPDLKAGENGSVVYLNAGNDLLAIQQRIESAGGKVISEKHLVSKEIGYVALFLDTEGNRLALHSRS